MIGETDVPTLTDKFPLTHVYVDAPNGKGNAQPHPNLELGWISKFRESPELVECDSVRPIALLPNHRSCDL